MDRVHGPPVMDPGSWTPCHGPGPWQGVHGPGPWKWSVVPVQIGGPWTPGPCFVLTLTGLASCLYIFSQCLKFHGPPLWTGSMDPWSMFCAHPEGKATSERWQGIIYVCTWRPQSRFYHQDLLTNCSDDQIQIYIQQNWYHNLSNT